MPQSHCKGIIVQPNSDRKRGHSADVPAHSGNDPQNTTAGQKRQNSCLLRQKFPLITCTVTSIRGQAILGQKPSVSQLPSGQQLPRDRGDCPGTVEYSLTVLTICYCILSDNLEIRCMPTIAAFKYCVA